MKLQLKEPLPGALHLLGALLFIAGLVLLIVFGHDSAWKVVSFTIYASTFIVLYSASTIYHWLPHTAGGKNQIFRKLDHLAIYLAIAGTYTPFCLITLQGAWGWSIFGVVWGLALIGVIVQAVYINVWRWLTTLLYIIMGWLIIIAMQPLISNLPLEGFKLLAAGGIVYTIGGVIYTIKKPNLAPWFNYHSLWHILVLIGSILHYMVMFLYLTQAGTL